MSFPGSVPGKWNCSDTPKKQAQWILGVPKSHGRDTDLESVSHKHWAAEVSFPGSVPGKWIGWSDKLLLSLDLLVYSALHTASIQQHATSAVDSVCNPDHDSRSQHADGDGALCVQPCVNSARGISLNKAFINSVKYGDRVNPNRTPEPPPEPSRPL